MPHSNSFDLLEVSLEDQQVRLDSLSWNQSPDMAGCKSKCKFQTLWEVPVKFKQRKIEKEPSRVLVRLESLLSRNL